MIGPFERTLFEPVDAVRVYLVRQSVLWLTAFDIWFTRIGSAARYDADGLNVAHFAWLDWIVPAPSPGLIIAACLITGVLAVATALLPLSLSWRVALVVCYTFTWAVSRLDSYQHHYLLSWLLACIAFFPQHRASDLVRTASRRARRKDRASAPSGRTSATISAWAWVALGWLVGVVYVWTAVAKLDHVWQSGAPLQQLSGTAWLIRPLANLAGETIWPLAAKATVIVELVIAAGYALVAWLDRRRTAGAACIRVAVLVSAVALHVSFEFAGLKIGWFSWYMLLLAVAYFMPPRWTPAVGEALAAFARPLDRILVEPPGRLSAHPVNALFPAAVAVGLIAVGYWLDLPGSLWVGALGAAAMLVCRQSYKMPQAAPVFLLAGVLMATSVASSNARSQYYSYRLAEMHRQGRTDACRALLARAVKYVRANDLHGQHDVGWVLATSPDDAVRDGAASVEFARRACELVEYKNASAVDTLACALAASGDFQQAIEHSDQAAGLLEGIDSPLHKTIAEHRRLFSDGQAAIYQSQYRYAR